MASVGGKRMASVGGKRSRTTTKETEPDDESCLQKLVYEIAKTIMVLDNSKKPFKLSDINPYLSSTPSRKQWTQLLPEVKKELNNIGLQLVEMKRNPKSFFLIATDYPPPIMYEFAPREEVANRVLLTLILAYIFMKEGSVTATDLFRHLTKLKVFNDRETEHIYFGDIKRKINIDFVSQLYLEKSTDKETGIVTMRWGERAEAEVSKMGILNFVCKFGYRGAIRPEDLGSHYQKALGIVEPEEEINLDDNDSIFDDLEVSSVDTSMFDTN